MTAPLRTGPWKLSDLKDVPKNGLKVFSCFHCGGGSSMGYKLSGYDVLGGVEIDPKIMEIYRTNHNPRHSYLMGVEEFNKIPDEDLPMELFQLDILDGSPPCSSFSMAGAREKKWGTSSKFREGQTDQVLDDLFFHFIRTAEKLKPKVVIAENVKGLLIGSARGYVKEIFKAFDEAGYICQLFLLNASKMGVPQRRERTFFISRRKDLAVSPIKFMFSEKDISVKESFVGITKLGRALIGDSISLWENTKPGQSFEDAHPKGFRFNEKKLPENLPAMTITTKGTQYHYASPSRILDEHYIRLQSFPDDFNFLTEKAQYVSGMSVPPFMMQRVADQIERQWLKPVKTKLRKKEKI